MMHVRRACKTAGAARGAGCRRAANGARICTFCKLCMREAAHVRHETVATFHAATPFLRDAHARAVAASVRRLFLLFSK